MLAFNLRRVARAVLVMLTVTFIAFMLFQLVADPVNDMPGQDATPEQRQQLRVDLGLDRPFIDEGNKQLSSGTWRLVVFPGTMLVLIALSINLFGDWCAAR